MEVKLKIGKREFPFQVTERLKELVKEAHVNLDLVKDEKPRESKRFAFLAVKAACAEADQEFAYTFEEFMNFVEPECVKKAAKLAAQLAPKRKAKSTGRKAKAAAAKAAAKAPAKESAKAKKEEQATPDEK